MSGVNKLHRTFVYMNITKQSTNLQTSSFDSICRNFIGQLRYEQYR